jgi:putative transposase
VINRVAMHDTTCPAIPAAPKRLAYPSDLTDEQWKLIAPFVRVDEAKLGPQQVLHSRQEVVNAILYRTRTGCQWRYLPHDLPDWQIVFHYFQLWTRNGTLKRLHDSLRDAVRAKAGKRAEPTAAVLDSQSVKSAEEANERGYDAGKKVKGRKRHLLVDTLGLILVICISTADIQDRDAAVQILPHAATEFPTLELIWADGGYQGPRVANAAKAAGVSVEVVKRSDKQKGFVVVPKRWIVERTNAWISRDRVLAKDYERTGESAEALIQVSMIRHMVKRLAA